MIQYDNNMNLDETKYYKIKQMLYVCLLLFNKNTKIYNLYLCCIHIHVDINFNEN